MPLASTATRHVKTLKAFGHDIPVYLPSEVDQMQKFVRETGRFHEEELLIALCARLPETPTVVDVGANIGNHTLFFGRVLDAQVISIEPVPEAFDILEKNVALNGLEDQVERHQLALGRSAGRGHIVDLTASNLGFARVEETDQGSVEISTLDALIKARHVDLLKVDVRGQGDRVLEGGMSTIERCKPLIVAEASCREELNRIEQLLWPLGYQKAERFGASGAYLFRTCLERAQDSRSYTRRILDSVAEQLPATSGLYAGLSTSVENDAALRATVTSLLPQVDGLFVHLHGVKEVPEYLHRMDKVTCVLCDDPVQPGDAGRFWGLEHIENAIYLACSDDYLYPTDYALRMVQELAQTEGKGIVCVDGILLQYPASPADIKRAKSRFRPTDPLVRRRRIHVPATSSCGFHTGTVNLKMADHTAGDSAEEWLVTYAEQHGIARYAIPRPATWLQPLRAENADTQRRRTASAATDSRAQDGETSALRDLLPISLANQGADARIVLCDLERDGKIISALDSLRPGTRDPIVFILCDEITEKLRAMIAQHRSCWEVHLLSRHQPCPDDCRALLARETIQLEYHKSVNGRMQLAEMTEDLRSWLATPLQ
jgi:FkbM family methyltransferase